MVQAQASVMSSIDLYWFLTVGTAIMFFFPFLLKKNDPRAGAHVLSTDSRVLSEDLPCDNAVARNSRASILVSGGGSRELSAFLEGDCRFRSKA